MPTLYRLPAQILLAHPRPALPHRRRRRRRVSAPGSGAPTLMPETCNLKPSSSRNGGDEPTVYLQGDTGNVGGGGGEQEGRRPPQFFRLTVTFEGYSCAHVALLLLGRDAELLGPRLVERSGTCRVDAPWGHAVDPDRGPELFRQDFHERRHPGAQHVRGVETLYRLAHRGGSYKEHGGALVHLRDEGA